MFNYKDYYINRDNLAELPVNQSVVKKMAIKIQKGNSKQIFIYFDYSPERVKKVKQIEGRIWCGQDKNWKIPATEASLEKLFLLFNNEIIYIDALLHIPNEKHKKHSFKVWMGESLKLMEQKMILKGYSYKTIKSYLGHIKRIASLNIKTLKEIDEENATKYLLYLIEVEKNSHTYVNQALSAIKFLLKNVHGKNVAINIPRPKKELKLPNILSEEEVGKVLEALQNLKHRAILFLTYSAGLRVSEVISLKIEDIDSSRRLIHIRQGKGRKDRYTLLSDVALEVLRLYIKKYRPDCWLFPGADETQHITERTVQRVLKDAAKKANIHKNITVHSLRNAFATHLLEGGTDLRYIQKLLGHSSSKTTEIYTHVSKKDISRIKSPLDRITTLNPLPDK